MSDLSIETCLGSSYAIRTSSPTVYVMLLLSCLGDHSRMVSEIVIVTDKHGSYTSRLKVKESVSPLVDPKSSGVTTATIVIE